MANLSNWFLNAYTKALRVSHGFCSILLSISKYMRRIPASAIIGKKYNQLTPLYEMEPYRKQPSGESRRRFWCRCSCGNEKAILLNQLRFRNAKTCGCSGAGGVSHQKSGHPLYRVWRAMHDRCRNPNCRSYRHYGGRGIRVCERWADFTNFYADMSSSYAAHKLSNGERNTTIERIDNDGDYCPENCKWATYREQLINRRTSILVTFNGKTQCAADWARELGIKHASWLSKRIRKGMPMEAIFAELHGDSDGRFRQAA